jgi:hypothetical protein
VPATPEHPSVPAARLVLAVVLSGALCYLGATHLSRHLSGPASIVGYPIYADFDPNHYLVVFYFVALVFPLLSLALYHLEASVGPLRRPPELRRHVRREGAAPVLDALEGPSWGSLAGAFGVASVVGATLGLAVAVFTAASGGAVILLVLGGGVLFAALGSALAAVRRGGSQSAAGEVAWLALAGVVGALVALYGISERTAVVVSPGVHVVHYRFLPLWLLLALLALGAGGTTRALRRGHSPERIARGIAVYFVVPLALFLVFALLPGALGKMDAFGEGEYLGGSYLLLHGYLPWKNLYLIHGVLDDGLKPLVGYGLFGMTRWGATAGIDFVWAPAYWIATYLFAALVFGRRWVALAAAAAAVGLGVFADWDLRYLIWPLLLALLAATLRRRSWPLAALLGFGALVQFLLVPEMAYAAVTLTVTLLAFECYEARSRRPGWRDFPRSLGFLGAMALAGVGFLCWLAAIGGISGFIGYFSDFASAHSLSGGIPLFTNYALPGQHAPLGVLNFAVLHLGLFTRYPLELALPLLGALATFALFCAAIRGGRRLYVEDWVTLCAAGLAVMYFPKGLSRADTGHIGESFALSVPMLICLTYRLTVYLDGRTRALLTRLSAARDGSARRSAGVLARLGALASPVGIVAVVLVVLLSPASPVTALEASPAHFRAAVSAPPAPVVGGAGGLGYESGALPNGLVRDLAAVIRTYAGPKGAVFDFTNAPAVFDFLLGAPPGSRFYDINLTITEAAQRQAVEDLEASKPRLVIFEGEVGLPRWDYLENEVRDHVVSEYVLSHYRPLALVDGELVLLADNVADPPPLPSLTTPAVTKDLYYSQRACAFGYVPDFLPAPSEAGATAVPIVQVAAPASQGRVYRVLLPKASSAYRYLEVSRSDTTSGGAFAIANLRARSRRDISWAVQTGRASTAVEVGACLQWHGFPKTLYLRYKGPGTPTSVALLP